MLLVGNYRRRPRKNSTKGVLTQICAGDGDTKNEYKGAPRNRPGLERQSRWYLNDYNGDVSVTPVEVVMKGVLTILCVDDGDTKK